MNDVELIQEILTRWPKCKFRIRKRILASGVKKYFKKYFVITLPEEEEDIEGGMYFKLRDVVKKYYPECSISSCNNITITIAEF